MDDETEAQRGNITYPKSPHWLVAELGDSPSVWIHSPVFDSKQYCTQRAPKGAKMEVPLPWTPRQILDGPGERCGNTGPANTGPTDGWPAA